MSEEFENFTKEYKILATSIRMPTSGLVGKVASPVGNIIPKKVDPKFQDRLYLVNNVVGKSPGNSSQIVWNNPMGGALEWNYFSNAFIIDTKGDVG